MPEVCSLFAAVLCGLAPAAAQLPPSRGERVNLSAPTVAQYEKLEATISLRTRYVQASIWHQEMSDYPTTCAPSTPGRTSPPPASRARRDA